MAGAIPSVSVPVSVPLPFSATNNPFIIHKLIISFFEFLFREKEIKPPHKAIIHFSFPFHFSFFTLISLYCQLFFPHLSSVSLSRKALVQFSDSK
uniref:Uncharacterized protein n=1 Tax=Salix viminalis TaxID=40686 RepID=A0A6N2NCF7_SALVM